MASREGVLHGVGDLACETVDERAIAAFHHHAQKRFRSGRTQQHTTTVAERLLGMTSANRKETGVAGTAGHDNDIPICILRKAEQTLGVPRKAFRATVSTSLCLENMTSVEPPSSPVIFTTSADVSVRGDLKDGLDNPPSSHRV